MAQDHGIQVCFLPIPPAAVLGHNLVKGLIYAQQDRTR